MRQTITFINLAFILISIRVNAQTKVPTVQDLDFLIGKWEITFELFDTHNPTEEPLRTEKGWQVCEFDLEYNGVPMFIICKGEVEVDSGTRVGRKRQFQESIRYGRFSNSFERIGIFSNWPATSAETLSYDSITRKLVIRDNLNVQNNMLERYVDTYQFNEDYSSYKRSNIANFSDMPITEYNLTLRGTGKKIE